MTYAAALRAGSTPTLFEHSDLLGRVVHDPALGLAPSFERLSNGVEATGVTAAQPIAAAEAEQLTALPSLDEAFFAMAGGRSSIELEHAVRARVAFFRKTHGWLYAMAARLHPAFTHWLDTPIGSGPAPDAAGLLRFERATAPSGRAMLVLARGVSFEEFPAHAQPFVDVVRAHIEQRVDGPDERLWLLKVGAHSLSISWDGSDPDVIVMAADDTPDSALSGLADRLA
ncbi:MAG: hypothetical protein IPI67_39425 [Myxococcales bacterium]|nr:hypothetical protein [Myxococcales bacterium]